MAIQPSFYDRIPGSIRIAEAPELVGRLTAETIEAVKQTPVDFEYDQLKEFGPSKLSVVRMVELEFITITRTTDYSDTRITRYGIWRPEADKERQSKTFHSDHIRPGVPAISHAVVIGQTTECAIGECEDTGEYEFTPLPGAEIHPLDEGGIYRFTPYVIHREPSGGDTHTRLFMIDLDYA